MISWYLEIRKKSYTAFFVLFSKILKGVQKTDWDVNVYFLYFSSMKARDKILYQISLECWGIFGMVKSSWKSLCDEWWWELVKRIRIHIQKKRLRTHLGSLGNKIKTNVSVRTKAKNWRLSFSTWMRTHALRWEIRTCYETVGKIQRKFKCDLSEVNEYPCSRETLRY